MILKFYKNNDIAETHNVIECSHYQTNKHSNRVEVIVYKDYFTKEGVTYILTKDTLDLKDISYRICFVENDNGKTIDTIRPNTLT